MRTFLLDLVNPIFARTKSGRLVWIQDGVAIPWWVWAIWWVALVACVVIAVVG